MMDGFSPISPPRIFWNSRKRSASARSLENSLKEEGNSRVLNDITKENKTESTQLNDNKKQDDPKPDISDRRRALFEPLEPIGHRGDGKNRTPAEELLPPPDFDSTSYPKGWLVGKKRKLVNVDVVESMRRIAIQEMNRKDREIDGLNEQLEEDGKCLERLQLQLLDERSKRADAERENGMLKNQISMLMSMFEEGDEAVEGDAP
ncbi:protein HEADING DATE REPRESSOR 1 [Phalaenopsis equestris]|uniref:protein HEADING DATE REPRESSOR 1 n=1 Tax=Phalaenopsis equestris TaxID=78828 RepID=UPI0009E1BEBB|nr:protein HEADING DATE REPRESSOR 1 [Phalaenopsis equestris]